MAIGSPAVRRHAVSALVTQPVEVSRDAWGIPHIKARSLEDALFVQGYVTAEDRMWQMDTLRRLAKRMDSKRD